MKLTAKEVYEKLLNDDKILTQQGRITFKFSNVDIIVKQKDVVGNIMQEWLEGWLRHNGIEYAPNEVDKERFIFHMVDSNYVYINK